MYHVSCTSTSTTTSTSTSTTTPYNQLISIPHNKILTITTTMTKIMTTILAIIYMYITVIIMMMILILISILLLLLLLLLLIIIMMILIITLLAERGEGTVDWETVASNCSTGSCLSSFNKRISSKSSNRKNIARDNEVFQPYHPPLRQAASKAGRYGRLDGNTVRSIVIISYMYWFSLYIAKYSYK